MEVARHLPLYALIFGIGLLCGEVSIVCYLSPGQSAGAGLKMSYPEFVSILLTGIGVILAVLALFIASLAVWGYSQFKDMTRAASAEHLEKMLKAGAFRKEIEDLIIKHVSSQLERGQLRDILVERVDQIIQGDAARRSKNESPDTDFKD
jgi:hypothetical protein